jgi:alkyl-hydroperoxide reductase/thiol specific antioxidant family protein
MFCVEQVAQLRDAVPEIHRRGASFAVVGNGTAAQAKAFAERWKVAFPVLVSPDLSAYAAAGLERSYTAAINLTTLRRLVEVRAKGIRQTRTQGDAWQLGGALVLSPAGEVLFEQVAQHPADHVAPEDLLAALGPPPAT